MRRDLSLFPSPKVAEPLGAEEFDAAMTAFAPFAPGAIVALAVSGGPDSMAMAWCAKAWAGEKGCELKAFIVDHALRAASAAEAQETRQQLVKLGIGADILRWDHLPISSRLHAAARRARYALLADACRRHGARALLLAHHQEDQAETILMRFAKGSGIDGLAGMDGQTDTGGIRLLRPLLRFSKERLIATCRAARLSFVIDPSNGSEKFARGRLRRIAPLLADEGFTAERLIDLGARAAEARDALDHYTDALLRVAATCDMFGVVHFDLEHLRAAPQAIALRALSLCLQTIHAEDYAPEYAALVRLHEFLRDDEDTAPRTLHGSLIGKNARQANFMREHAAISAALPIRPGESVLWDARWQVTLAKNAGAGPYAVRPLGALPHDLLDRHAPGLRHRLPQGRARASLPALWDGETLAFIPVFTDPEAPAACRAQLATNLRLSTNLLASG